MDSAKVNDWLQIAGMLGIIASLVFVGVQVRLTQEIGEGESATHYMEATIAGRQLLINNSDIWVRGCMGEEMSIADEAKFANLYRAYLQASYFAWLGSRNGILELNPDDVVFAYAASLHRYPGIAQISASWRDWAAEGIQGGLESGAIFGNAIRTRVAELQEIEPDPQYDAKWCGM